MPSCWMMHWPQNKFTRLELLLFTYFAHCESNSSANAVSPAFHVARARLRILLDLIYKALQCNYVQVCWTFLISTFKRRFDARRARISLCFGDCSSLILFHASDCFGIILGFVGAVKSKALVFTSVDSEGPR